MTQAKIHPACELFPMMSDTEFRELKESIREYGGNREPITYWNGQLIDGRNRLRACNELGIEATADELDYDCDPWQYVIDHNLHRRHLNTSQRATVAAKLAKLKHGGDRKSEEIKGQKCTLIKDAADALNVSERSVKNAKTVLRDGSEELQQAVERGEVAVTKAATIAKTIPKEQQLAKAKEKPKGATPVVTVTDAQAAIDRLYDVLRTALNAIPQEGKPEAANAVVECCIEYRIDLKPFVARMSESAETS